MMQNQFEKLRASWDSFTDREKRILAVAGAAIFAALLALPFMLMASANGELEQEIDDIKTLLDDIEQRRERLQLLVAQRRQAEKRYKQKAPQLGGFIESLAREQELTIQEAKDEPEKMVGKFRRRLVQVSIPRVALTPIIRLMAAVESSRYPVAVERLQIEHFQPGDSYNLRLGVLAFDKQSADAEKSSEGEEAEDEADGEELE